MNTEPMNLLFLCSDEHNKSMLGCSGHPVVQTPHLDRLALSGVTFSNAYCNSPICVPSRASLATGRYVHQIGNWDNAFPYTGHFPSWGHRLTEQGYPVTTIGKLHYRDVRDDTGFPDMRLPMHVWEGKGDIYSLVRDNLEPRQANRHKILEAGAGDTSYTRYDRGIAAEARRFLQEQAGNADKPWVLFVSLVTPHFPLIAPKEYYDLYPLENVILPKQYRLHERPMHPVLEAYRHVWATEDEFDEMTLRKAIAAYYGLCTFMDAQVGEILRTLEETGLNERTRIIYTSDHGDTLGDHGLWFKSTMYETSVGVPFIMSGPDLPKGAVVDRPVSLVDCYPTIIDSVGAQLSDEDLDMPGTSLLPIARGESAPERIVFSEYHAMGFITGAFMIRKGPYKYVYYPNYPPQLFDLVDDPDELHDLSQHPEYREVLAECHSELCSIAVPEEIQAAALRDQAKKIKENGGKEAILKEGFQIVFSPVPEPFR